MVCLCLCVRHLNRFRHACVVLVISIYKTYWIAMVVLCANFKQDIYSFRFAVSRFRCPRRQALYSRDQEERNCPGALNRSVITCEGAVPTENSELINQNLYIEAASVFSLFDNMTARPLPVTVSFQIGPALCSQGRPKPCR